MSLFFGKERREGLLIKLLNLGREGKIYECIKDFLYDRKIEVTIENKYSQSKTTGEY